MNEGGREAVGAADGVVTASQCPSPACARDRARCYAFRVRPDTPEVTPLE
jgi:hypothetical protein